MMGIILFHNHASKEKMKKNRKKSEWANDVKKP
jgi:hypothetical protein